MDASLAEWPSATVRDVAGRHLKELFRAFRTHDELAFRRAALEIIEEEQGKHHTALARDLRSLLAAGNGSVVDSGAYAILPEPPTDREGNWPLAQVRRPGYSLSDLVINQAASSAIEGLITESRRWTDLDHYGLPRQQRILFQGPPGCGKTSAAEALATELGRPFIIVSIDAVVSSYLGETASNLRRIFDYADQAPFIVLFDEFDALGRNRDDSSEHGEIKRVVTTFLQMLDKYSGPSILIAATNHPGLLDRALWRRFDEVLDFTKPTVHELRQVIRLRLRAMPHAGVGIDQYAAALKGYPHAAAEKLAIDAQRSAVINDRREIGTADMDQALARVTARRWE
jgi:SpoVK/Ycf46/Vps4 family AAA+-type ATPase